MFKNIEIILTVEWTGEVTSDLLPASLVMRIESILQQFRSGKH